MAIKFDDVLGFGDMVRVQPQNADLQPSLPDHSGASKGDLGMDPIPGLEPRPVAALPFRNLKQK